MGGIITGVNRNIKELKDGENIDQMQERVIEIEEEEWRIFTIYSKSEIKLIEEQLEHRGNMNITNLMLAGDFNARTAEQGSRINEQDGNEIKRNSKDKILNKEGERLLHLIEENGWNLLNGNTKGDEEGNLTFIDTKGESVIDYCIVNERARNKIKSFRVLLSAETQHQPLQVELECRKIEEKETEYTSFVSWTDESIQRYKYNLTEKLSPTNNMYDLTEITKRCLPHRIKKKKDINIRVWWNKRCEKGRKKMRRALRKWKQNEVTKEEYLKEKKRYKELCENRKDEYAKEEKEKIENLKNEGDIWGYIKAERKEQRTVSRNVNMDAWYTHFVAQLEGSAEKSVNIFTSRHMQEPISEISIEEVRRQINLLKKHKAPGEDSIQNEAWIYGTDAQIESLTNVLNRIWMGEGFPENWKKGIIIPIHKKGDRHLAKNYRGITLLDTAYKIYVMLLTEKLLFEVEDKNIVPDNQAGFRKGKSAIDNVYILNYVIQKEISKEQGRLYALFADLKAAFDTVNRQKLFAMMNHLGIAENLVNRIAEIYSETLSSIRVNDKESSPFWTTRGLRQGCPMSPLLFSIYLSDIELELEKGQTGGVVIGRQKFWSLLYADDLVIAATTKDEMVSLIKRTEKYLSKKEMTLSTEKSKIVRFSKSRGREAREEWFWKGEKIEKVKTIKYLGYTFQKNGNHDCHIKELRKKANIIMAQIWGIGERRFRDNFNLRMFLFDKTVVSVALYAAEIWGWEEFQEIERLQYKYIRWLLGLNTFTPIYILLEETKRYNLSIEYGKRAMAYENKLRESPWKVLAHDAYQEISKKEGKYSKDYYEQKRKKFFENKGYSLRQVQDMQCANGNFTELILNRERDIQVQTRREKIRHSNSNPQYKQIITIDRPYYLQNNCKHLRIIARFRLGNEEAANQYWKKEEEKRCRICHQDRETINHLRRDCIEALTHPASTANILHEEHADVTWMKKVLEYRNRE